LHTLHTLHTLHSPHTPHTHSPFNSNISIIGKNWPNLEELSVRDIIRFGTAPTLVDIVTAHAVATMPHLQRLFIVGYNYVTNYLFSCLAKHCRELKVLRVSKCDKITDEAVEALVEGCLLLEDLALKRGSSLSIRYSNI